MNAAAVATLSETVRAALVQLEEMFELVVEPHETGSAIVTVHGIEISSKWSPPVIDLTFEIPFNYPFAAIYPYYTRSELARTHGAANPSALQRVQWRDGVWTQISLRANKWSPQVDTAVGAVLQVQHWLRSA